MTRSRDTANIVDIPTAKGDIYTASAANTPAKLAVGSDGSILVANSVASTGLGWAGQPYQQPVINSAFQVWQRGTSFALPANTQTYTSDRWAGYRFVTGSTLSRQTTSDTTNLPNIQYCTRVQRDSGNTATDQIWLSQSFETINTIPYVGKTITLSYYARRGSNYSATSNLMYPFLWTGTGTDQNVASYTGATDILGSTSVTLTTTWQRFTHTATVGTTATEMAIQFRHAPTGTAGANDYFEVTGVQIDLGSVALPFRTYAGTIQGELAACQRYYWRWNAGGTYRFTGAGAAYSTTQASIYIAYPVTMRTGATALDTSGMTCHLLKNDSYNSTGSFSLANQQESNTQVVYTHGSGIFTAGDFVNLSNAGTSTGYIGFTAEL